MVKHYLPLRRKRAAEIDRGDFRVKLKRFHGEYHKIHHSNEIRCLIGIGYLKRFALSDTKAENAAVPVTKYLIILFYLQENLQTLQQRRLFFPGIEEIRVKCVQMHAVDRIIL